MAKIMNTNGLHLSGGGVEPARSKHFGAFTKRKGFTLVEVLITIGIIGVVAALTIPVLIQNSNSKKFKTQFKKTLSTLNQAAIGAQAQYDMDYSTISQASNAQSCGSDSLSGGQYTLCGLFNNTLSGHTYSGAYGTVPGANNTAPYNADFKSINPEGFLIYSLADGSMVGFNPELSGCGVTAGTLIDNELLSGKLSKCLGFIDVNGVNPPNAEITCADGTTELNPSKICEIKSIGSTTGDIYPVVFHDGTVAPATNAAMSALLGDKAAKDENATVETPRELTPEEKLARRRDFSKWEVQRVTTPMTKAECEAKKESLGITGCYYGNDYWAAAVEKCGGVQNLPTEDDLYELAKKVYGESNCRDSNKQCYGTPDFSQLPESFSGLGSSWDRLWSGSENSSGTAFTRYFGSSASYRDFDGRGTSGFRVVCVGDLEKQ